MPEKSEKALIFFRSAADVKGDNMGYDETDGMKGADMNDTVFQAALAGLLHDIGKFAQRAGQTFGIPWNEDENSDIQREYKYQHALYTDQVVEKVVPDQWRQVVHGAAGHHHHPQTSLEQVVALADYLSAGERADERKDHPRQLQSIFYSLGGGTTMLGQPGRTVTKKYLPLKELAISADTIFPTDEVADTDLVYAELWREFLRQAEMLKTMHTGQKGDKNAYLCGMQDLMQRYTWCIPSAYYRNVPDVSLCDHSRMTAALAACLVGLSSLPAPESDTPVALLVGGDISGVQRFIYTITSSGAAKSLRGRSFYLQLLTEGVASYVLEQLGLPLTNLIYAGGGNFFLLAQVGQDQEDKLDEVAKDVSQRLLAAHDGELHLILAQTPVEARQFKVGKFYAAWDELHRILNEKKLKPLANLDDSTLAEKIGQGMGVGGDEEQVCAICGREDDQTKPKDSGGDMVRTCRLCDSFEKLGNELVKATHLVVVYGKVQARQRIDRWWHGLELFGVNFWAINGDKPAEEERYLKKLPGQPRLVEIVTLKEEASYSQKVQAELAQIPAPKLHTFHLFTQLVPTEEDRNTGQERPLTFDELAEQATATDSAGRRWSGLKRWGVLRLDVDNLGALFSEGFKARNGQQGQEVNTLSLSRLASLSFALRLFFEGWLPELGKISFADERLLNRLYVQYAGGDDVFVVGSWDALPEFALAIRESFAEYVGRNPAVTLSGGVSLATVKYPLYQAADDAEKAEKKAKKFERPDHGRDKDAVCFLEQTVDWEEFHRVKERAYQLAKWCGDNGIVSRALLQNLMSIHREYREGRDEAIKHKKWQPGQIYFGPWMWHLAYQMARRIESKQTPEAIKEELRKLEKAMLDNQQNIETIGLAARWAQYLIRK